MVAGDLDQPVRIRRVGRPDDQNQIAFPGELLDRDLAVGRGVTDVLALGGDDSGEAFPQPGDDLGGLVDREGRLGDQRDVVGIFDHEIVDLFNGLDQDDAVRSLAHSAFDLLVTLVADHDDRIAVGGELAGLDVDLGHQRTGRVDRAQVAGVRVLVDRGCDSVGAEDDDLALRDLGLFFDEDRATLGELLDHMLVVDDLLANVDGGAVLIERLLYGLYCTIDTGAVAARRSEDHFFDTCGRSRSHT